MLCYFYMYVCTYSHTHVLTHTVSHSHTHKHTHFALSTPRNMHKVGFDFCSNAFFFRFFFQRTVNQIYITFFSSEIRDI